MHDKAAQLPAVDHGKRVTITPMTKAADVVTLRQDIRKAAFHG